jgi:hypothetical protein
VYLIRHNLFGGQNWYTYCRWFWKHVNYVEFIDFIQLSVFHIIALIDMTREYSTGNSVEGHGLL